MIGLLPAGGRATRIHMVPKFLLPLRETYLLDFHLKQMQAAGLTDVFLCASHATAPLLAPYMRPGVHMTVGDTGTLNGDLLQMANRQAVVYAMPDTYWTGEQVISRLAAWLPGLNPIALAAVWPLRDDQRGHLGQCRIEKECITDIVDKDPACPYPWVWGALAWSAAFWRYLEPDDPHPGYALRKAIQDGQRVGAVMVDGDYYDCGTFDGYARLCASMLLEAV